MKVKILNRNPDDCMRDTTQDIHKVPRNYDESLHQLRSLREYKRAVNAAKLHKLFAKPFLQNLGGHSETICCLAKSLVSLTTIASGDYNGEVRLWDLFDRTCSWSSYAHNGILSGLTFNGSGEHLITIGSDKTIKMWKTKPDLYQSKIMPIKIISSENTLSGISYNKLANKFITCGTVCELWEEDRNAPLHTFNWDTDTVFYARFNPIEPNILGTCSKDNTIVLHDIREAQSFAKVTLTLRSNQLAWNPMEAYHFAVANEDFNAYSFDMRNFSRYIDKHVGHTMGVSSIDFSPTGLEFVTGSFDRTLRIYKNTNAISRDMYHTQRMKSVTDVIWTMDDTYILNSSSEMNIRLWKARSSQKLGQTSRKEMNARNYSSALLDKFSHFPEIKNIRDKRRMPIYIKSRMLQLREQRLAQERKELNVMKHNTNKKNKQSTAEDKPRKSEIIVEKRFY